MVVGSTAEQRGPEQQNSQGGVWTSMARAPPATARRVPRGSHINIHNTSPRVLCVGAVSWVTRSAVATVRRPQQTAERRENQSEPVSLTRLEGTGRLARSIVSACNF